MSFHPHLPEVIYVAELAALMGKSEVAVRQALNRGVDWLPAPFYLGRRLAWRRTDVQHWLAERAQETQR